MQALLQLVHIVSPTPRPPSLLKCRRTAMAAAQLALSLMRPEQRSSAFGLPIMLFMHAHMALWPRLPDTRKTIRLGLSPCYHSCHGSDMDQTLSQPGKHQGQAASLNAGDGCRC